MWISVQHRRYLQWIQVQTPIGTLRTGSRKDKEEKRILAKITSVYNSSLITFGFDQSTTRIIEADLIRLMEPKVFIVHTSGRIITAQPYYQIRPDNPTLPLTTLEASGANDMLFSWDCDTWRTESQDHKVQIELRQLRDVQSSDGSQSHKCYKPSHASWDRSQCCDGMRTTRKRPFHIR